jgi:hypothetical protein
MLTLKELVRNYNNLVEDATRVMLRTKALFRARAIGTSGTSVYRAAQRQAWLDQLPPGARLRAKTLLEQLDLLLELRPKAKAAMIAEAKKHSGWKPLRSIPFLGPVRVAQLMAIMGTPHRFRTKRNLWPYSGLAVVTRSSADQSAADAWSEPEPQPDAQVHLQRRIHCRGNKARTAQRHLRGVRGPRHQAGVSQGHPGAEDRLDRTPLVEERRTLGSNETDIANDIALGEND